MSKIEHVWFTLLHIKIIIVIDIVFEVDKSTELVNSSNELLQKTHPYFYIRMGKIAMKKKLLVSK